MPKIRKAYKFRLKTNKEIEEKLTRFCDCARFVWNKSLAMNLERLEKGQGIIWYQELAFWLRRIRGIPRRCAPVAGMWPKRTGDHRRFSSAWFVVMKKMPILTLRRIF